MSAPSRFDDPAPFNELVIIPHASQAHDAWGALDLRSIAVTQTRLDHQSLHAAFSADLECAHGTCPGDARPQVPECECFVTKTTPDLMGVLAQAEKEIHVQNETPVVPTIALRVEEHMRSCEHKVSPSDVGAALELTGEQVGHHLKRMTLAGTLKAEGQTRGRRYWNPNSYVEPDHTPEPEPVEVDPIEVDPIEAGGARHALEDSDCPIGVAVDALTHRLLMMDAARAEIQDQIATLEVQLGQSNDARARLVMAISGLENLDEPVQAGYVRPAA